MTDTTVRNAAQTLLDACIQDFGNPDDFPGDDGAVAFGEQGDCAVSFKHLRALREALAAQPSAGAQAWGHAYRRRSFEDGIPLEDVPWNLQKEDDGFLMSLRADPEHWEVQPLYATPAQPDTGDVAALREALERSAGHLEACASVFDKRQPQDAASRQTRRGLVLEWAGRARKTLAALSKPNAPGAGKPTVADAFRGEANMPPYRYQQTDLTDGSVSSCATKTENGVV